MVCGTARWKRPKKAAPAQCSKHPCVAYSVSFLPMVRACHQDLGYRVKTLDIDSVLRQAAVWSVLWLLRLNSCTVQCSRQRRL